MTPSLLLVTGLLFLDTPQWARSNEGGNRLKAADGAECAVHFRVVWRDWDGRKETANHLGEGTITWWNALGRTKHPTICPTSDKERATLTFTWSSRDASRRVTTMKVTERDEGRVFGRGLAGSREKVVSTPIEATEEYREAYAELQCPDGKVVASFTRETRPRDEPEKIPFQDAIEAMEAKITACSVH